MFKAESAGRGLSALQLIASLEVPPATLYRALAGSASAATAQAIGGELGLTAVAIAAKHHLDEVTAALAEERPGSRRRAALARQRQELLDFLSWENPYRARGTCRRVGFAALRSSRGFDHAKLGHELRKRSSGSKFRDHVAELREYEERRSSDANLEGWLRVLGTSPERLDQCARTLLDFHILQERAPSRDLQRGLGTVSWDRKIEGQHTVGPMTIFGPERSGSMRWGRSATIFGAIRVELIDVRQTRGCRRGEIRLVNASHPSFVLGLLIRGKVRMTVRRTPFPAEEREDRPNFARMKDILADREFSQGAIISLNARRPHRLEFLAKENLIALIIIDANVALARRFGGRC